METKYTGGDVQRCSNYREIKLMSHTLKIWDRAAEARLRKEVRISEQQHRSLCRERALQIQCLL